MKFIYLFLIILSSLTVGCSLINHNHGVYKRDGDFSVTFDTLNTMVISKDSAILKGTIREKYGNDSFPYSTVFIKEIKDTLHADKKGCFTIKLHTGIYNLSAIDLMTRYQVLKAKVSLRPQHIVNIIFNLGDTYQK